MKLTSMEKLILYKKIAKIRDELTELQAMVTSAELIKEKEK